MLDNKFLDKVMDQILSETNIDYDKEKICVPFGALYSSFFPFHFFSLFQLSSPDSLPFLLASFLSHCKNVYCLNKEESEYVWEKYKKELTSIINEKELC